MSTHPCAFQSLKTLCAPGTNGLGIEMEPVERICFSGEMIPSVKAPSATYGFTVEPGAYKPDTARLRNGFRGFVRYCCIEVRSSPRERIAESYSGQLTSAISSPVS